jgi:hypothetical protein
MPASTIPAVAQAVREQRAGQPVLERSRRMDRLIREVDVDSPLDGQREGVQMGVGRTVGIGLETAYRLVGPVARRLGSATVR